MGLFGGSKPAPAAGPPERPRGFGTVGNIADALLLGGLGRAVQNGGYRRDLADYKAAEVQAKAKDLLAMFEPPAPTAMTPGLPLNAGTNLAVQPAAAMPSIADPAVVRRLLGAKLAGVDVGPVLDVLKANKAPDPQITTAPNGEAYDQHDRTNIGRRFGNPTNINGTIADLNDPENLNRVIPEAPVKGAMPVYDNRGRVVDWTMPSGSLAAIGAAKDAETGAEARARAPYTPDNRTGADGRPVYGVTADRLAGPLAGQSPADAEREKTRTAAQADLPKVQAQASQAIGLVNKILSHPALGQRTGLLAKLPAIPGTPGADFDVLTGQLKGKVFLEAFQTLKGGGQITEIEGQKAEAAIARLDKAQSPAAYQEALTEVRSVFAAGLARAEAAAKPAASRPAGGGYSRAAIAAEMKRRGIAP